MMNSVAKIPILRVPRGKREQLFGQHNGATVVATINGTPTPIGKDQKPKVAGTRNSRVSTEHRTVNKHCDPKRPSCRESIVVSLANVGFQPQRRMIAPAAVGCKSWLGCASRSGLAQDFVQSSAQEVDAFIDIPWLDAQCFVYCWMYKLGVGGLGTLVLGK